MAKYLLSHLTTFRVVNWLLPIVLLLSSSILFSFIDDKHDPKKRVTTPSFLPKSSARPFDADPIKFTLQADKRTASVGEEVTLTITAHYLNIPAALLFTAAGSNAFRLKVLLPDGFVQTGGDYIDYIGTELSPVRPTVVYTLKGHFDKPGSKAEFRLLRSHAHADASSLFVEKARLSIQARVIDLSQQSQKSAREGSCSYSEGQFLFTTSWGESVYAHYYNGILFSAAQNGDGFKPQHWLVATGQMTTSVASCFAENDPHSTTTNPPTNPPTGNCSYAEGQFLFTTSWGESVYAHYYNGILFSAAQNGDGFKPQHWLVATGQMTASVASCFAEDDPHTTTTPPTNPPTGNCSYSEGQYLFTFNNAEAMYAHYYNGILFAAYQDGSNFRPQHWLIAAGYDTSKASCFAENDPHSTTTTPANPATGNCNYTEGQYLFTFNNAEAIYAHFYNGVLFAAYQNGSNFRPQHWLVATGLMNSSTASCFAENDPTPSGYFYSQPNLQQYSPSYDDDADPVSFGGAGGLANATVGNTLPSNLTPYAAELQQVFPRGLSINNYYEYELQIMANTILNKLGLTSIDQLEQPPFLPVSQLDGLGQALQVAREFVVVKQKNPTWSNNRCIAQAYMNYCLRTVHFLLDAAGLVPGVGELPDAINGGIYLLEGDKTNAALSLAATVPLAGWVATGGKWAKSGLKALGNSAFESAEGLIWASRTYGSDKESIHALSHIYKHFKNDPTKKFHGIFTIPTNELVGLVDDAWHKVKNNATGIVRTVGNNGNISYSIPMGTTIGNQGGKLGSQKALNRVNIVLDGNNPNHIVTAFPE